METLSKHVDTVIIVGGILASVLWMNGKFNQIGEKLNDIDKRMVKVETIIYIKGLVSNELAAYGEKK